MACAPEGGQRCSMSSADSRLQAAFPSQEAAEEEEAEKEAEDDVLGSGCFLRSTGMGFLLCFPNQRCAWSDSGYLFTRQSWCLPRAFVFSSYLSDAACC